MPLWAFCRCVQGCFWEEIYMININRIVENNLCSGCCECLSACPENSIYILFNGQMGHPAPFVDDNVCLGCGECVAVCPGGKMLDTQKVS